MILVSACLAGLEVRYNGTHSIDQRITKLVKEGKAISICPELLGGFSTPREPAEIIGGNGDDVLAGKASVIERSGKDVTELYIKGAYATLKQVKKLHITTVVLKEDSPSCGTSSIYNGEFKGLKIPGRGVTAALLKREGLEVISEKQWDERAYLDG
ncbi:uncharacterized protein YbbK (DUF523 family) [Natronobacillus azotifigens]|uniref:DUF523 domain-containing protein n=1 Tax=Natronobacillus azotifigens TaxID=472978 RepID=A0A9J6RF89_9BACI|nr:DUF523 domain-containing protein [Natronobacillus azotifigens]MCZ0703841.1 DUF523 domain-containing protein [Natronobacillus azotifigens]